MTISCPKCHGLPRPIPCPRCTGLGVLHLTDSEAARSMRQRLETWRECTPDAYSDPEEYYQPKPEPKQFED